MARVRAEPMQYLRALMVFLIKEKNQTYETLRAFLLQNATKRADFTEADIENLVINNRTRWTPNRVLIFVLSLEAQLTEAEMQKVRGKISPLFAGLAADNTNLNRMTPEKIERIERLRELMIAVKTAHGNNNFRTRDLLRQIDPQFITDTFPPSDNMIGTFTRGKTRYPYWTDMQIDILTQRCEVILKDAQPVISGEPTPPEA